MSPDSESHSAASTVAVFTIVRDEPFHLSRWFDYYAAHFPTSSLHVLHHVTGAEEEADGQFAAALACFVPENVVRVVNPHFCPAWLRETVHAQFGTLLLKYDAVLFAEADELLVAVPPATLGSYAAAFVRSSQVAVRCVGYEMHHDFTREPPLDCSRPLLAQRSSWHRNVKYDKALLSKRPLQYSLGFHECEEDVPQDDALWLVHTHKYDFHEWLKRHEARARYAHSNDAIANGWNAHYRTTGAALLPQYMNVPAALEPIPPWVREALVAL